MNAFKRKIADKVESAAAAKILKLDEGETSVQKAANVNLDDKPNFIASDNLTKTSLQNKIPQHLDSTHFTEKTTVNETQTENSIAPDSKATSLIQSRRGSQVSVFIFFN